MPLSGQSGPGSGTEVPRAIGGIDALPELAHLQRLAATGLLAAGIGHDLASMAQHLSGRCELALRRADPAAHTVALAEVREYADRISEMVRVLLRFLARDYGARTPVHVESVVEDALRFLKPALGKGRPVTITRSFHGRHEVMAERTRLLQALLNVLSNALRAARSGGGSVQVRVYGEAAVVVIAITDDGPGIPLHVRDRLFEPFVRGVSDTEPGSEGTGLGLYISRRLLAELGGRIEFETAEGLGTTFRLLLAREPSRPGENGSGS